MIIVPNNLYMNIDKSLLKQLWSIKPWNKIENMFKDIPACPIPKYKTLTLDQQQWIEFSIENFDKTKGYDDFSNKTRLDFSQGDYLIFSIDTDSGNAHINIDITVEFYIDDTL